MVLTLSSELRDYDSAAEDIEQVEHIRSLLEDIQNVRQDKIRNGLYKISSDVQNGGTAYAIQVRATALCCVAFDSKEHED